MHKYCSLTSFETSSTLCNKFKIEITVPKSVPCVALANVFMILALLRREPNKTLLRLIEAKFQYQRSRGSLLIIAIGIKKISHTFEKTSLKTWAALSWCNWCWSTIRADLDIHGTHCVKTIVIPCYRVKFLVIRNIIYGSVFIFNLQKV